MFVLFLFLFRADLALKDWESQPLPEKGEDQRFIGGFAACCNPNDHNERPFFGESRYFFRRSRLKEDSYDSRK